MVKFYDPKGFWESQSESIRNMYIDQCMPIREIAAFYNVGYMKMSSIINHFGLSKRAGKDRPNALIHIDSTFFDDINSEEKAYSLGYLITDGHVTPNGRFSFSTQACDADVLYKIGNALKYDGIYRTRIVQGKEHVSIGFNALYMKKRLDLMGVDNHKSITLDINKVTPFIPTELERHFIRGMFDGDGGVGIYNYGYFKKPQVNVNFTGRENVCEYIRDKFGIQTKFQAYPWTKQVVSVRCSCWADCVHIGHYMYDDATIYMNRKYNKFQELFETYEKR